jgi:hypothetical protein
MKQCIKNTKQTEQTINKVLNRNKTREKLPDSFLQKNSNRNITDPIDIANKFNEYFDILLLCNAQLQGHICMTP